MPERTQDKQDEILRSVNALFQPGDVHELRIFGGQNGYKVTMAGWFDDLEKLAQVAADHSGRPEIEGIYVTLNPCNRDLFARCANRIDRLKHATGDKDILRRAHFLIDIDSVRVSGVSATDAEKAHAHAIGKQVWTYLRDQGWPEAAVADSGNGYNISFASISLRNLCQSLPAHDACRQR